MPQSNFGWVWTIFTWGVLPVLIVLFAVWVFVNYRARRLSNEFGSFKCWSRPDTNSGWAAGIGMYGQETLTWYRLVGLSNQPVYTLPRRSLEVSAPQPHVEDGSVVEVRLRSGQERLEVLVDPQTYNGLVSWVESGPPAQRL